MTTRISGSFVPQTDEERAAGNEVILKHMEKKFITDRTPEKFAERVDAIWPERVLAALGLGVEPQTMKRWCRGSSRVTDTAWILLGRIEKERADANHNCRK